MCLIPKYSDEGTITYTTTSERQQNLRNASSGGLVMKLTPIEHRIKERKRHWIGHTLRTPQGAVERHALDWNPQGTGKDG